MKLFNSKIDQKVGLPPGDIKHIGEQKKWNTSIKIIQYNEEIFEQNDLSNPDDLLKVNNGNIVWIDIEGFSNHKLIKDIGKYYNIHEMILEDIFNTNHLPKYEEGEDKLIFIIKSFSKDEEEIKTAHVTIILKKNLIISFREMPTNLLVPKIDRIKIGRGRARRKKGDYLFFVLIDSFIDSYYLFFENLREQALELESNILENPKENYIKDIYQIKNTLTSIRKDLFPLKNAINQIITEEPDFIMEDNFKYFSDCKDHANELIEYYHSFGEMINNLITLNENNLNNNTNRIMKVLTIIATIFIPLTFIAGIYGMNFEFMPELKWKYGYFAALFIMLSISVFIILFMKKKKWI
jgi:magnesium transporter